MRLVILKKFIENNYSFVNIKPQAIVQETNNEAVANTPTTPNPSSTSTKPYFEEMIKSHSLLKDTKWKLPSGIFVEDKMLDYCHDLDYEHLIENTSMTHAGKKYLNQKIFEYIKTESLPPFATTQDEDVDAYVESFKKKVTYNELMKHLTKYSPYTSKEKYDITWLQQLIMNLLPNY
ncbi:hypothetical protein BDC45DRAFT_535938 [Circinella umbellata]|nr:hypothetical protein BDC45DRAFT_535938 [Circinella umbellata]